MTSSLSSADTSESGDELLSRMNLLFLANREPSLVLETLRCFKNREFLTRIIKSGKGEELLRCVKNCTALESPVPKIALQVAYNVAAVDGSLSKVLWRDFKSELASHISDEDHCEAACLIVLICCRNGAVLHSDPHLLAIFDALNSAGTDDAFLAMEAAALIPNVYESLDLPKQISVLHCLNTLHSDLLHKKADPAVCNLLDVVARKFDFRVSSTVLNLNKDAPEPDVWQIRELLAMLDLLGTMAASDAYRPHLQEKAFLVISAAGFLKVLYDREKAESVPEQLREPAVEDTNLLRQVRDGLAAPRITSSPSFQLKENLVKLVGNLAFRNKATQDLVREFGALPALLNSCRLDARNPYLMQWAILAIRNMCEGNAENQKLVDSLKNEGLAVSARSILENFRGDLCDPKQFEAAVLRIRKP